MSIFTLPPSPLYYLKTARESFHTQLIMGTEDKAYWHYTLAAKRLAEAEELKSLNLPYWQFQVQAAQYHLRIADEHLLTLIDKTDVNYLLNMQAYNNSTILKLTNP